MSHSPNKQYNEQVQHLFNKSAKIDKKDSGRSSKRKMTSRITDSNLILNSERQETSLAMNRERSSKAYKDQSYETYYKGAFD